MIAMINEYSKNKKHTDDIRKERNNPVLYGHYKDIHQYEIEEILDFK